jgi:hypothetical protein
MTTWRFKRSWRAFDRSVFAVVGHAGDGGELLALGGTPPLYRLPLPETEGDHRRVVAVLTCPAARRGARGSPCRRGQISTGNPLLDWTQ